MFIDTVARLATHLRSHDIDPNDELRTVLSNSAALLDKIDRLADALCAHDEYEPLRLELDRFHGRSRSAAIAAL